MIALPSAAIAQNRLLCARALKTYRKKVQVFTPDKAVLVKSITNFKFKNSYKELKSSKSHLKVTKRNAKMGMAHNVDGFAQLRN